MTVVSIVIPCFRNERHLAQTLEGIVASTTKLGASGVDLELILVDDASSDGTWEVIRTWKDERAIPIKGIRLGVNVGSYRAILSGLEAASGDAVIVMAADGDDPPLLIPTLVEHWQRGHLLVQAVRDSVTGSLTDRLISRIFYASLRIIGMRNVPAHGSDFMLADRSIVQSALQKGFRPGNSLIQLYQHADHAAVIPYRKGKRPGSGWSRARKAALFLNSLMTALNLTRPFQPVSAVEET
ncbi:MAG: glycosyltransferase [Flavobacteriales bacterium]|nr:glycosyltransferase [Flavobacteriales bacterium]